jgi:M3 family oligoendopeptidase
MGTVLAATWTNEIGSFDPSIADDLVTESQLQTRYTELRGAAKIDFRGESLNLSALGAFLDADDRETRHEAWHAYWGWFADHGEALDTLYGELVSLRHTMATKLGLTDFVDLGYRRMNRMDYDRDDVRAFRAEVRDEIVPLVARIRRWQANELGLETLTIADEPVFDARGNPRPRGDGPWMVERATEMFDAMHDDLGAFFRMMVERDLLDLEARDGKAGGGFCSAFPDFEVPFIFANFNGSAGDVRVFTHEAGHAFQAWSSRKQPWVELLWPTYEAAEIHSMSLEFLTWAHMDRFFGEDADRFRRTHLIEALCFIPYGVAIDHFQHLVYETPNATPAERHAMWLQMEATYLPWRVHGDIPHTAKGGFWQKQLHVFGAPFYYIDYTLAGTVALQLWSRLDDDFDGAFEAWLALCRRGGEAPFRTLVAHAGLQSPFERGCLSDVAARAAAWLGV